MAMMYSFATVGLLFTSLCIQDTSGLSCPAGFEVHGTSCYLFSHGKETWHGARDSCKLFSSKLVEVNDATENTYLSHKTGALGHDWWIGLTDKRVVGEYIWETSMHQLTAGEFTDWGVGEPDAGDDENCVYYGSSKGYKWGDSSCTRDKHYICEIDGKRKGKGKQQDE